jgi:hypothetical protein
MPVYHGAAGPALSTEWCVVARRSSRVIPDRSRPDPFTDFFSANQGHKNSTYSAAHKKNNDPLKGYAAL